MANAARLSAVSGPKQARSERTLRRLLDAAEQLIAEKGHRAVSIPEIARRAHSSVGGFYARFRDKNELLRALEERHFLQLTERVERLVDAGRWTAAHTADIIEAAVAELVAVTRERRPMIAAFLANSLDDPVLLEGGLRFRRSVELRLSRLLLTRRDEMSHPDPPAAIDFAVQMAFALMQQHVLFEDPRSPGTLSDDDLRREISLLVLRYLGIAPRPSARGRHPRRS
ncbi:MAG: TetR/AcrR family transcriptional regulator [Candidatus Binatia bacterium]